MIPWIFEQTERGKLRWTKREVPMGAIRYWSEHPEANIYFVFSVCDGLSGFTLDIMQRQKPWEGLLSWWEVVLRFRPDELVQRFSYLGGGHILEQLQSLIESSNYIKRPTNT